MKQEVFNLEDLEIKVKINEQKNMLAQVELDYGDLKLYGFRVMKSKFADGLFIQPPSVRAGTKWLWLTKINNPEKWNELQNMIKEKYLDKKTRYDKGEFETEDIDPEDIPF